MRIIKLKTFRWNENCWKCNFHDEFRVGGKMIKLQTTSDTFKIFTKIFS